MLEVNFNVFATKPFALTWTVQSTQDPFEFFLLNKFITAFLQIFLFVFRLCHVKCLVPFLIPQ